MFKKIKLNKIKEYKFNPRKISEDERKKLSNSISEFGLVDPIIIDLKDNKIIGGHQRYNLLKEQGVKEVYIIEIGDIGWCFTDTKLTVEDENHEKALNLALNKIGGEWDNEKLKMLDVDLNNIFDENIKIDIPDDENENDEVPKPFVFTLTFKDDNEFSSWLNILSKINEIYNGDEEISVKIINFIKDNEICIKN